MHNILEWIKNHKKICIAAGVVLLAAIICGIWRIFIYTGTSWKSGGAQTSAPFRYRMKNSHTVEIRVDTKNVSDDGFVILTNNTDQLQSSKKRQKGKELVYEILIGDDAERMSWSLAYYEVSDNGQSDTMTYRLTLEIVKNDKNRWDITAEAGDIAVMQTLTNDTCEVKYKISGSQLQLELVKPENIVWETEYDEKLLSVGNVFSSGSTSTANVQAMADGDWETTVVFYNTIMGEEGEWIHDQEIKLHIKGTANAISEVTLE